MLKPEIFKLEITNELRRKLQQKIFSTLFNNIDELPPLRRTKEGTPSFTVTEIKERLKVLIPIYSKDIGHHFQITPGNTGIDAFNIGNRLHDWLKEVILFFRREGADCLREGLSLPDQDTSYHFVWSSLFHRKLISLAQSSGLLKNDSDVEKCDMLIECIKLWVREICISLRKLNLKKFTPSAYFLDLETPLNATIAFGDKKLHLRSRPDAITLNESTGEICLWEYKFGCQGQYELQIAQVLFYMSLIEAVKGVTCKSAVLWSFIPREEIVPLKARKNINIDEPAPPFPEEVEEAFSGYIGNELSVRKLKVKLTLAARRKPRKMPDNIMFCGPAGLGKTELARRVASCLDLPFINIPATSLITFPATSRSYLELLVSEIDRALKELNMEAEEIGTDSGKPLLKYPPLVLFIDEAHKLSRKADEFLNFFEPKERRAVVKEFVGDFVDATILLATTDKGMLPSAFLTRFRMIDLIPYTCEEVGMIVSEEFRNNQMKIPPPDVCQGIAKAGRLIPRLALNLIGDFLEQNEFNAESFPFSMEGLQNMFRKVWMVDENGLTSNDFKYLECVNDQPRGILALNNLLPCKIEELKNSIEPYLMLINAAKSTKRGRSITEYGRMILKNKPEWA
ncbi:MAG: AAA family ATPase [Planctomycetes bacterium]|nr:AAA family ATPase [Planctomycetota bacterium]